MTPTPAPAIPAPSAATSSGRPAGRRAARASLLAAAIAALLAGGCATKPAAVGPSAVPSAVPSAAPSAGQPRAPAGDAAAAPPAVVSPVRGCPPPTATPPARRGGGFYLDDGPGDNPPPNLASIPDAEPRVEPLHRFANRPYVVFGRSYTPMTERMPYTARGVATWYGKRYHAQKTSSGEVYDMYAMTAAHPTLPIPSFVRVTNLANGCSAVVRVNDRGPFIGDRLIDLSYAAAFRLGFVHAGTATVEVEKLIPGVNWPPGGIRVAKPAVPGAAVSPIADKAPVPAAAAGQAAEGAAAAQVTAIALPPAAASAPSALPPLAQAATVQAGAGAAAGATQTAVPPIVPPRSGNLPLATERGSGFFLQLGAFADRGNAETFLGRIRPELGDTGASAHVFLARGLHRVHIGPFAAEREARAAAEQLMRTLSIKPMVTVR